MKSKKVWKKRVRSKKRNRDESGEQSRSKNHSVKRSFRDMKLKAAEIHTSSIRKINSTDRTKKNFLKQTSKTDLQSKKTVRRDSSL